MEVLFVNGISKTDSSGSAKTAKDANPLPIQTLSEKGRTMSQDELRELLLKLSQGRRDAAFELADLIYSLQNVQGSPTESKPVAKKVTKKAEA